MRKLALALLDDDHGITEEAWKLLLVHLRRDCDDIIASIEGVDGRIYLPENWQEKEE